jgi:hypothetical protein
MDNEPQSVQDKEPISTSNEPEVDMVSYHESQQGATSNDLPEIAGLFKAVGNELYTLDSRNVGGESSPKALQLDKSSVFSGIDKTSSPPPDAPTSIANIQSPTGDNPFAPVLKDAPQPLLHPKPPPVPPVPPRAPMTQPVSRTSSEDVLAIEKRLTRLESANRAFKNSRKIKRGNVYSVSSNSMKGQLKDGELVAEFVMSELAKGVKTITIKLNDSKHSE